MLEPKLIEQTQNANDSRNRCTLKYNGKTTAETITACNLLKKGKNSQHELKLMNVCIHVTKARADAKVRKRAR